MWGDGTTAKVIWDVVRADPPLRLGSRSWRARSPDLCAIVSSRRGGELDQIQFLLGHVSIQTTERYLGCKQKLRYAVNDTLGLEPEAVA